LLQISYSAELKALLTPAERQRQLIWVISTCIVLMLAAAGAIIAPDEPAITPQNAANDIYLIIFHFIGIGLGVFSLIIRTYTYADRRVLAVLSGQRMSVPGSITIPQEQALWRLFRITGPVQMLGWIMNCLIMVTGVIATAYSGRLDTIYPFVFIALVLQILSFPRFAPLAARATGLMEQYELHGERSGDQND